MRPAAPVAFEETPQEMESNVASLGFELKNLVDRKKMVSRLCLCRTE